MQHKIRSARELPLETAAELEFVRALKEIRHIDGRVKTTITTEMKEGFSAGQVLRNTKQAEVPQGNAPAPAVKFVAKVSMSNSE